MRTPAGVRGKRRYGASTHLTGNIHIYLHKIRLYEFFVICVLNLWELRIKQNRKIIIRNENNNIYSQSYCFLQTNILW